MALLLVIALLAGVLTILAPCTLPVVPLVLGAGAERQRRPVAVALGFAGSFAVVTVLLAALLAAAGLSAGALRFLTAIGLASFGLLLLLPSATAGVGARLAPLVAAGAAVSTGSDLAVGTALGILWAPCAGPIMAGVIAAAVSRGPSLETLAIALAYGLGAAIPLVAIGSWGRAVARRLGRLARGATERAAGALLLAGALAIAIGIDAPIQQTASSLLPDGWTAALYAIETQTAIQEELRHMDITPTARAALPDLGAAPELRGITDWINSEPLSLEQLRGSVVLVHFWTFGCINCQNVQPYVKAWYARYHDQGFAVIGVHTPELSFERDIANVRAAVASKGVTFPVAFDPKFATWNAYRNSYWPAFYFVDKSGHVRYVHFGEGEYERSERVIEELLAEGT